MNFKPMLSADASDIDLKTLRFPLLASPKLDGLRCILWEGVAYSRNAKPFRNRFVQKWAERYHNLDGEIVVGSPTDPLCLLNSKAVTAYEGEPDFTFWLFDSIEGVSQKFEDRLAHVQDEHGDEPRIAPVPHAVIRSVEDLLMEEERYLTQGYEGIMLRHPEGPYKNGRSTLREGWLMKLKRFQDGEATVIRLEEGTRNDNVQLRDELGRAKRSSARAGLVPNGMVGAIIVMDPQWGELRIAPGTMTHAERRTFWDSPSMLIGTPIHWRSFGYGVKDKPRFPRYYGIKDEA